MNVSGAAWDEVVAYAEKRIATLTKECTSVASDDDGRRHAAMRIDELRRLLDEPQRARMAAEARKATVEAY